MHAPFGAEAPGQRHVDRFAGELRLKRSLRELFAARIERGFDGLLGLIDFLTARTAFFRRKGTELLHQHGHSTGLADVFRLGVFQGGRLFGLSKVPAGGLNEFGKILHIH